MSTDTSLPRLRRDLRLHQGPRLRDGSPTLTIEDPVRGHYFRVGWAEAEILSRWREGNAASMAEKISSQTTLQITESDVLAFVDFLKGRQLIETGGGADTDRLIRLAASQQIGWLRWLLHNYLFLRIPLVRPDRFLDRTMGWVRPLTSRLFLMATLIAGLLGLAMAVRQWDSFLHTFLYFFTLEGAAAAGLTLIMVKVLHELGHAYACKLYDCRVPTMGVALLVLWPVLYTDTTAAWRLTQRHQRLVIGAAGMMTELVVAAWATLVWSFLPDGVLRSAAFTLATTTWILTLAVNLSPLMRFDGYFLLSDLLDVPNLQPRAFALARWGLRKTLFGIADPPPEHFERWLRLTLLIYAYATWIYRFFLFLGIALLVYHFAFKVLGLVLFSVEIVCFILLPIQREVRDWWHRRRDLSMNHHTMATGVGLLVLVLLLVLPWRDRVEAPALLRAGQQSIVVMPVGGQVREIAVQPGQNVEPGQVLFRLGAPEQEHALAQLDRQIAILREQSRYQRRDGRESARQQVAGQELDAALRRRGALAGQMEQLEVSAAFHGRVADLTTPLRPGEWLPQGEWLATVVGPQGGRAEAFVIEHDLERLNPGATAWFIPEDPSHPRQKLRVEDIAGTATRTLDAVPELASPYQGDIAAHAERDHTLVPTQAMYRVLLAAEDTAPAPERTLRGTVSIDAQSSSLLAQFWRSALTVLTREMFLWIRWLRCALLVGFWLAGWLFRSVSGCRWQWNVHGKVRGKVRTRPARSSPCPAGIKVWGHWCALWPLRFRACVWDWAGLCLRFWWQPRPWCRWRSLTGSTACCPTSSFIPCWAWDCWWTPWGCWSRFRMLSLVPLSAMAACGVSRGDTGWFSGWREWGRVTLSFWLRSGRGWDGRPCCRSPLPPPWWRWLCRWAAAFFVGTEP